MAARFSIAQRLVFASLIILPFYLTITGFYLADAHERSLLAAAREQLQLRFYNLLGAVEWNGQQLQVSKRLHEARYRQFRSGLYAAISDGSGEILWRSTSMDGLPIAAEALQLPAEQSSGEAVVDEWPTPEKLFRYRYAVTWVDDAGERRLVLTVLESQAGFLAARKQFQQQLLIWLSGVGVALLLAQWLILRWGLRPLRGLTGELRLLESGAREALSDDYPAELQGVTTGLNQLLQRERQLRERYRHTLADLAHSLKTPLAVLRNHLHAQSSETAETLDRMDRIISYQLQRPISAGTTHLGKRLVLKPVVSRLINALAKVYADKAIDFATDIGADQLFPGTEEDATELLGNLLDNACKACRRQVQIRAATIDHTLRLVVADDGSGIPVTQHNTLLKRGQRGDQYAGGHGIGLAIVADIVASHQGRIHIADSPLGGAAFIIELPA